MTTPTTPRERPDARIYGDPDAWRRAKHRVPIANPAMLDEHPAFAFVERDPSLPDVLLIGDSVSIGYTPAVREALAGRANVLRVPTNGGWTGRGLDEIEHWLAGIPWSVIHFNWGLHDLKRTNPDAVGGADDRQGGERIGGSFLVPPEAYRQNLHTLVRRLKETDARLVWTSTTPVPVGSVNRIAGDELAYNAIAAGVMEHHAVPVHDLHATASPHLARLQRPADVHFTDEGSRFLGERVAESIAKELAAPTSR